MKKIFNLFVLMCVVLFTVVPLTSCSEDSSEKETVVDMGNVISGSYVGYLSYVNAGKSRCYVTVERLASDGVSLRIICDDLGVDMETTAVVSDNGMGFELVKESWNFLGVVSGDVMTFTYETASGETLSFTGVKD